MDFKRLEIPGVVLLGPKVFEDERGFFFESYKKELFDEIIGEEISFIQDNHSESKKGVIRGLHYQLPPFDQGKLVRVVYGEVFDVAVDIRKSSPTFGKWVGEYLSDKNKKQLWIPEGFAHGFITLSEKAYFVYKATKNYSKEHERCIKWDDSELGINWRGQGESLLSKKDMVGISLSEAEVFL